MSMRDFDEYVRALMGACKGYAEQAKHAKDDVECKSAGMWHDFYVAMIHGAVLGRAVERGEIDQRTAYNFTLARLLRMPTDDPRKVDEYAAGLNELRKWLDGDPDGE